MLCYFTAAVPAGVAFRDLKRVGGFVTLTGAVQRGGEIEPSFMRRQPHLATGRRLRL
jgi:hypothetical protein